MKRLLYTHWILTGPQHSVTRKRIMCVLELGKRITSKPHPQHILHRDCPVVFLISFAVLAVCEPATLVAYEEPVIYVDQSATAGTNTGGSWEDAYIDLQSALESASNGARIWVAQGVYKPDRGTGNRFMSFFIPSGVSLLGGFPAGGGCLDDREIDAYETVLTGDLNGNDSSAVITRIDNSFTIVRMNAVTDATLFDGFTIESAYGSSNEGAMSIGGSPTIGRCTFRFNSAQFGAAVHIAGLSLPSFVDCAFRDNTALAVGGACNLASGAKPTFEGCTFSDNHAGAGGAIYAEFADLEVRDAHFAHNVAALSGGAIESIHGRATIAACQFEHNQSGTTGGAISISLGSLHDIARTHFARNYSTFGGAIYHSGEDLILTNCAFAGNAASFGSALLEADERFRMYGCTVTGNRIDGDDGAIIYVGNGHLSEIRNSIVWGNETPSILEFAQNGADVDVYDSIVEGGWTEDGFVFDADPLFMDSPGLDGEHGTTDDDLRLEPLSPGIDRGVVTEIENIIGEFDLSGEPRLMCAAIDLGAFEFGMGDGDCDGRYGAADFGLFQICFGTSNVQRGDPCEVFDLDSNGHIDLMDFSHWIDLRP